MSSRSFGFGRTGCNLGARATYLGSSTTTAVWIGRREANHERLFSVIRWIPVDAGIARYAGSLGRRYRRSHAGIGAIELIIAATALELRAAGNGQRPPLPDVRRAAPSPVNKERIG